MNRNLDGIYFRVKREENYENVCFSDLSIEERDKVCEGRSAEWFKKMAYYLADRLRNIGDEFDILVE